MWKLGEALSSGQAPGLELTFRAYQFLDESLRSAERSGEHGDHHWIFAIVNIAQAIELMLKERLRREHEVLVFADVDKSRTNTVSFSQAITRLQRCGVQLSDDNLQRLRRARDLRNSLVHYAPDVTAGQLRSSYVDFLEFAHRFHLQELGEELYGCIAEDLWPAEALLMEEFQETYVTYQGSTMHNSWPSELVEAQFWPIIATSTGREYNRIRFGQEADFLGHRKVVVDRCGDCFALPGQLHGDGCDGEICPVCRGQFMCCSCAAQFLSEPSPVGAPLAMGRLSLASDLADSRGSVNDEY